MSSFKKPLVVSNGQVQELPANCTVAGALVPDFIAADEIVEIPSHRQLIVAYSLVNEGILINNGLVYVI